MTSETGEATFKDNEARQQYEVYVDGMLAGHDQYEGMGLGSRLVQFALDDLRARNLNAVPTCPFVAAYIRRHPEYLELVKPEQRRALGL